MLRPPAVLLLMTLLGAAAPQALPKPPPGLPAAFVPPPILMYHRVDVDHPTDPISRDLTISPRQFEGELAYLKSRGISGISMAELLRRLRTGEPLGHVVVLTFDDGYSDQYGYALPLLRRFGDSATFFIITSTLGTPKHLTWRDLRRMRADGMDICAHGVEHFDLSQMTPAEQAYQIDDSVRKLREYLHVPVEAYGYPSGRFNRETLKLVRDAGIALAVTTDPVFVLSPENRFEMTRVRVQHGWSVADFASALLAGRENAVIVRR